MSVEQMKKFMEPKSIAIFGVSRRSGDGTYNILEHLLQYGYKGKIFPINPHAGEILGIKTYAQVADIGQSIDLAVINLPRDIVPGVVKECAEAGIKAVIVLSQGFSDAIDEEGHRLQKQLDELRIQYGMRIMGPNSLGVANPFRDFSTSFARLNMSRIPVGVVCQSGLFFTLLYSGLLGKGIDIANAADIGFADCLEYFEDDPEIKVVVMHVEGMKNPARFISTAKRFTQKKPLLVIKTGRSEQAARAAASHSGSLIGADYVWDAAFKQCGIMRVNTAEELGDAAAAFSNLPLMKGRRIGMVSISGGLGVMTIDACHQNGLSMAKFSDKTMQVINSLAPSWQGMGNPADVWPAHMVQKNPMDKVVSESIGAVMQDPGVDAVIFAWGGTTHAHFAGISKIMTEVLKAPMEKPLVCCMMGSYYNDYKKALEATGKTAVYPSPERAVKALGYLARYSGLRFGF